LVGAGAAVVAQRLSRSWQPCVAGQQWEWDGVLWQVLHPAAGVQGDGNAASCVLRVQAANGAAVLLTGDIEAAQEAALLRSGQNLQADVLLAPHHGSRTSSSAAFLAAVAPHTVVVQAGYRNRFGHPAAPVLRRYAAQDLVVQSTPQCGAAHWNGVQAQTVACERSLRPRYWSHAPDR
jgi:competence protein ComEC